MKITSLLGSTLQLNMSVSVVPIAKEHVHTGHICRQFFNTYAFNPKIPYFQNGDNKKKQIVGLNEAEENVLRLCLLVVMKYYH